MDNDLIVLVADRHMEGAFTGLMSNPEKLGIRRIEPQIRIHPGRDPGCRTTAAEFLRPFLRSNRHAIVAFDRHGCGSDLMPVDIQSKVELQLSRNGWEQRSRVVVIDPELEAWVWAPNRHVSRMLGWGDDFGRLRAWLNGRGLWPSGHSKPLDPKQAMETAMRHAPNRKRPRRSSALFEGMANSSNPQCCNDSAFARLRDTLRAWFPAEN